MPLVFNWGNFTPTRPLQKYLTISRDLLFIMAEERVGATDI